MTAKLCSEIGVKPRNLVSDNSLIVLLIFFLGSRTEFLSLVPYEIRLLTKVRSELCKKFDFAGGHPILVKEIEEKNQMTTGSIVWGEYFEFPFLPDKQIKDIRLLIYRDTDRKKSRKDKDFIGLVNIPILSLSSGQFTEKWFPLATPKRSEG